MAINENINVGDITMDNDDWKRIETLMAAAVLPIKERLDMLPCADTSTKVENVAGRVTIIEAQRDAAKEQKKETKESRDWHLKIIMAGIAVLGLLQAYGVLKSFLK